jgi:head-tail adaptor
VSFASLLRHSLVIERFYPGVVAATSTVPEHPVLDDYGQPVYAWATFLTVAGLIQPRSATEVAVQSQGGATMTDAVAYVEPCAVLARDRIRLASDTSGPWYEITGVRDAAGHGHHLELDCRLVQ